eukprot:1665751-Pyramimonas_sp.AAC.1
MSVMDGRPARSCGVARSLFVTRFALSKQDRGFFRRILLLIIRFHPLRLLSSAALDQVSIHGDVLQHPKDVSDRPESADTRCKGSTVVIRRLRQ